MAPFSSGVDDLDPRTLTKPGRQRLRQAVRQQIHNLVAFKVDKDGAVAMASPPSPVVNAQNLLCRRRCLDDDRLGGHAQQRIRAGRDDKPLRQFCSSLTA